MKNSNNTIVRDLLLMQEKTAKCNGFVAGMVAQSWVIQMLGDKIREYGGSPYVLEKNPDGSFKVVLETKDQVQEEFPDEFVDISKIDFDQYESERFESGRKELVKGMEYVLSKYNDPHDREVIDEMLMTFTGWKLSTLVEKSKTQEYDDED